MSIKWRCCSSCKYYNGCGGSSSNPKWHPCIGWEKSLIKIKKET